MAQITLEVPDSVAPFAPDLQFFVQMMVRKLHTNRHKGFAEGATVNSLLAGLISETVELNDALNTTGQFEASIECTDVSNFAFLLFQRLHSIDKPTYKKEAGNGNS